MGEFLENRQRSKNLEGLRLPQINPKPRRTYNETFARCMMDQGLGLWPQPSLKQPTRTLNPPLVGLKKDKNGQRSEGHRARLAITRPEKSIDEPAALKRKKQPWPCQRDDQ